MKRIFRFPLILLLYLGYFLFSSKSCGFFEGTVILGDTTLPVKLAAMTDQLIETKKQLEEATKLVRATNTLVQIAGDPKSVVKSMSDLSSAARQMDQIFNTQTTHDFRKLVNASDSLQRSSKYFDKTVGDSFISGKKQVPRQANLYRVYALTESNYDSFTKLVETDRQVQKNEVRRQERFINDLTNAKTQAEVDKINASIAASKAAQDASSHQVMKHKMEIDMQKLAMDMEREKIETAEDEEEAEELRAAKARVVEKQKVYEKRFNKRAQNLKEAPSKIDLLT